MWLCKICNRYVNYSNKTYYYHLQKEHKLTSKDYIVLTEHNGKVPKCICGLCNEDAYFFRNKFRKHAKGHDKYQHKIKAYINKYGNPTCDVCNKDCGFTRGLPNKFCAKLCAGKIGGFSSIDVQNKIKQTIKNKYNVENISHLSSIKKKISIANKGKVPYAWTEQQRKNASKSMIALWIDKVYRDKVTKSIKKAANHPKEKERRRLQQLQRWEDPDIRIKLLKSLSRNNNRLTKLHRRIRDELKLNDLNFKSEQVVDRYIADELNNNYKVIVEINGNYAHANPLYFKKDDVIRLYGQTFTAAEKWDSDRKKINRLFSLGYKVIVVWESDDLEKKKQEILSSLEGNK